MFSDASAGIQVFEAFDFGPQTGQFDEAIPVLLKCFARRESFVVEVSSGAPTHDVLNLY